MKTRAWASFHANTRNRFPDQLGRRNGIGATRLRRDERGLRQVLLPGAADVDQVVAVGAIAVQEDDKVLRGSGFWRKSRAIEFSGHSCLFSVTLSDSLPRLRGRVRWGLVRRARLHAP